MKYEKRTYREHSSTRRMVSFTVSIRQTDLFISADKNLEEQARNAVMECRQTIESYIKANPEFSASLTPLPADPQAPEVIQRMISGAAAANVGPMATVAGAVAEYTGLKLLEFASEVIVENGGDIFLKTNEHTTVGVFAGQSPLSNRIGIKIPPSDGPRSVCTSSGRVGPSLSFGQADAVTTLSDSATLADAAATAIGNMIHHKSDIQQGLDYAQSITGIDGTLIIEGEELGVWGAVELVSL